MNDTEIPVETKAIRALYDSGIDTHTIARLLSEDIKFVNKKVDEYSINRKTPKREDGWVRVVPPTTNWASVAFFLYGHSLAMCNEDEMKNLRAMFPEMEKILKDNYSGARGKNESNN